MSLRAQAEADLGVAVEGSDWRVPFVLTDPAEFESATQLYGKYVDIGELMDAETGLSVSGEHVALSARTASILDAGYSAVPTGIADETLKPWRVAIEGEDFKVAESRPDKTLGAGLGLLMMILERYQAP